MAYWLHKIIYMNIRFPFAPEERSITGDNRRSFMVYFLCWMWAIVINVLLGLRIVFIRDFLLHDSLVIITTDVVLFTCLLINKKGHSKAAAYLFLFVCAIVLTVLVFTSGGVDTPAITGFLPMIFLAGILFGKRASIVAAVVSILIALAEVVLAKNGMLPATRLFNNPLSFFYGFATTAILTGVMQYISNHQTNLMFEKIKQEEERFRSLLNHASDPIMLMNADTTINDFNDAVMNLLGYTKEELKRMKITDIFSPGELERKPLQLEPLLANKTLRVERKWRTKDGRDVEMNLRVVLDGDGHLAIARDMTEYKLTEKKLRESEMRYRKIFENVLDVVFQTSMDGIIIEVSPSIMSHIGYTREELIGTKIIDIYYDPHDREKVMKLIREHGEIKDEEIRFKSKMGDLVYTAVSAKLYPATDNGPAYIEGIFNNITERVKHLNAIEGQNKKLREIAWIQSHVVRAPLARMMGLIEVFRFVERDSPEYAEWTEHFFNTANELDAVIREVSEKSKDL